MGKQKRIWIISCRICLLAALILLHVTSPIQRAAAAPLIVTSTEDSGAGTLREAVANALPGDTIAFAPDLPGDEITLSSQINLNKNLTIIGPGTKQLTISGGGQTQVFVITASAAVTITSLTIADGRTDFGQGGGIQNLGTLKLTNATLKNNLAQDGGALYSTGILTLTNVTISDNTAVNKGGGLYINWNSKYQQLAKLDQVTISNNSGDVGGGGLGLQDDGNR